MPTAAAPTRPRRSAAAAAVATDLATITLSSRNYSSWSLRGWLMVCFAGLPAKAEMVAADDAQARQEILLLAPSILVPKLMHRAIEVWDTQAIGEYLAEVAPGAGLLPSDQAARAHCRAVCGEMHSGFASLRSALPMNLKGDFPGFKVWNRAQADIDRITEIWRDCLERYGGPWLFGPQRGLADAMYAPVATRFRTYHVPLDKACSAWCDRVMSMPEMQAWIAAARTEPDEIEELDMEF